jgi:cell division protein FtsZ
MDRPVISKKVHTLNQETTASNTMVAEPPKETEEIVREEVQGMRLLIKKERTPSQEQEKKAQQEQPPEQAGQAEPPPVVKRYTLDLGVDNHSEKQNAEPAERQPEKHAERNPFKKVFDATNTFANPVSEEELRKKITDREMRLRELSVKIKSPEGLSDLEKQPAFVRRNVLLNKVPSSAESQVSRYTLYEGEDKQIQIKSNNSFLHDNVD